MQLLRCYPFQCAIKGCRSHRQHPGKRFRSASESEQQTGLDVKTMMWVCPAHGLLLSQPRPLVTDAALGAGEDYIVVPNLTDNDNATRLRGVSFACIPRRRQAAAGGRRQRSAAKDLATRACFHYRHPGAVQSGCLPPRQTAAASEPNTELQLGGIDRRASGLGGPGWCGSHRARELVW